MRSNIVRIVESVIIIGLLMPAGMLLAAQTQHAPAVNSSKANWYNAEQATNLFNRMQHLATKVQQNLGPLRVESIQLNWETQASWLDNSRYDVNRIGKDLMRLDATRKTIEPWQQSLISKVTPNVHEMVYQLDAAIKYINAHQNRYVLAMGDYPQNINYICRDANQMARTIRAVTRSAHAEQEVASLERATAKLTS